MSNQLRNYLNQQISKFSMITILPSKKSKKNKNYFLLKDGILQLSVIFNNDGINCQICQNPKKCNMKKCYHSYYILIKHFKLNLSQLSLLWKDDNWEKFIENHQFIADYSNEECGICLENIERRDGFNDFNNIYQCLNCTNFIHTKCKKKFKKDECIYCYESYKKNI